MVATGAELDGLRSIFQWIGMEAHRFEGLKRVAAAELHRFLVSPPAALKRVGAEIRRVVSPPKGLKWTGRVAMVRRLVSPPARL